MKITVSSQPMVSTDNTNEYYSINTPQGNIGFQLLGGSARIRIDNFPNGIADNTLWDKFTTAGGWKQPGNGGENYFSTMASPPLGLKAKLTVALEVLLKGVTEVEYVACIFDNVNQLWQECLRLAGKEVHQVESSPAPVDNTADTTRGRMNSLATILPEGFQHDSKLEGGSDIADDSNKK